MEKRGLGDGLRPGLVKRRAVGGSAMGVTSPSQRYMGQKETAASQPSVATRSFCAARNHLFLGTPAGLAADRPAWPGKGDGDLFVGAGYEASRARLQGEERRKRAARVRMRERELGMASWFRAGTPFWFPAWPCSLVGEGMVRFGAVQVDDNGQRRRLCGPPKPGLDVEEKLGHPVWSSFLSFSRSPRWGLGEGRACIFCRPSSIIWPCSRQRYRLVTR